MDKLIDLASTLRSKNAGPLKLTFDIMFSDKETYEKARDSGIINKQKISEIYHVKQEQVLIVNYDIVNSIKITIPRQHISGEIKDTDIYGCQQHVPLASLKII